MHTIFAIPRSHYWQSMEAHLSLVKLEGTACSDQYEYIQACIVHTLLAVVYVYVQLRVTKQRKKTFESSTKAVVGGHVC